MRGLRLLGWLLLAVVVLLGAALALLAFADFTPYREHLAEQVSVALQRRVTLRGKVSLLPAFTPTLVAEGVTIANPAWSTQPYFAHAKRLQLSLDLSALLQGKIEVVRLALIGAEVLYERNKAGEHNWHFESPPGSEPSPPPTSFPVLEVERSRLTIRIAGVQEVYTINVEQGTFDAPEGLPMLLQVQGSFRGQSFLLSASGGTYADLIQRRPRWPVSLSIEAGQSMLHAQGLVDDLLSLQGYRLSFRSQGSSLEPWARLLGSDPPPVGDYQLSGRFAKAGGDLALSGLAGKFHGSDGGLEITLGTGRVLAPTDGPFQIRAEGEAGGVHFTAHLNGAPLADLWQQAAAWPVQANLTLAGMAVRAKGTVGLGASGAAGRGASGAAGRGASGDAGRGASGAMSSTARPSFDLALQMLGSGFEELAPLFGVTLPMLGPLRAEAQLEGSANFWTLSQLSMSTGRSDLQGNISWQSSTGTSGAGRPLLSARLNSRQLHTTDLRPARGPLHESAGHRPSENPPAGNESTGSAGWLLSSLPRAVLGQAKVRAEVRVGRLEFPGGSVNDLNFQATLSDGRLELAPVSARLEGGAWRGRALYVAGGEDTPLLTLEAEARATDLAPVLAALGGPQLVRAKVDVLRLYVHAGGATPLEMLRGATVELGLRDMQMLHNRAAGGPVHISLAALEVATLAGEITELSASGLVNGRPLALKASGGTPLALLLGQERWPLAATLRLSGATAELSGQFGPHQDGAKLRLDAKVAVPKPKRLMALVAPKWPDLTPLGSLTFRAQISHDGRTLTLENLRGNWGRSDLTGSIRYAPGTKRDRFTVDLRTPRLELEPLLAVLGLGKDAPGQDPPQQTPQSSSSSLLSLGKALPASPPPPPPRLIPVGAWPLAWLKRTDLDVRFHAVTLAQGDVVQGPASFHARTEDGQFLLEPVTVRLAGGHISGSATLETLGASPRTTLRLDVTDYEYGRLLRRAGSGGRSEGQGSISIRLHGSGAGLRETLANADGVVEFVGHSGVIENRFLNLWSDNLLSNLTPKLRKQEVTNIRCAVGRFEVTDGMAASRSLLLSLEGVDIKAHGSIGFKTETVDFLVWPETRDRSLLRVATPVTVRGSLAQPKVLPQTQGMVTEAAWFVVGANNPLLFVVDLIKPQQKEANPCLKASLEAASAKPDQTKPRSRIEQTGDSLLDMGRSVRDTLTPDFSWLRKLVPSRESKDDNHAEALRGGDKGQ